MVSKSAVSQKKEEQENALTALKQDFYPWHLKQQDFLLELAANGRMHHALLLYGPSHLGKFDFACAFSAAMLCEQKNNTGVACQTCHACHLVEAMTHPDLYVLRPEKAGKQIRVEEIRELTRFMSKSAGRSGKRMVIIDQCQQMNMSASNALLKFLEEPGESVHLLLVCNEIDALMPTIRSRCQKLRFPQVDEDQTRQWLHEQMGDAVDSALFEYANGSPLFAQKLLDDPVFNKRKQLLAGLKQVLLEQHGVLEISHLLEDVDLIDFLQYWHAYCVDILKILSGAESQQLRFQSHYAVFESMAAYLSGHHGEKVLLVFMESVFQSRLQLVRGAPINRSLCIGSLLQDWQTL